VTISGVLQAQTRHTWHLDCVIFEEEFLKYAAPVPRFIILFLVGRSTFWVAAAVKFVVLVQ
jgi:hypothetical protein